MKYEELLKKSSRNQLPLGLTSPKFQIFPRKATKEAKTGKKRKEKNYKKVLLNISSFNLLAKPFRETLKIQ